MATSSDFLDLFFYPGEKVLLGLSQRETRFIQDLEVMKNLPAIGEMERVSLNPVVTDCIDNNVTAFRNIMIESDVIPLHLISGHLKKFKVPYSAAVYSGNKSIHFYVCLEESLKDINLYRFVCEWIFNILGAKQKFNNEQLIDSKNKSPSRKARLGGGLNRTTNVRQTWQKMRDKIPNRELQEWLLKFPEHQPKVVEKEFERRSTTPNPHMLKPWTHMLMSDGIWQGKRNASFYEAAWDFAQCGFDYKQTVEYMAKHSLNIKVGDFSIRELETTVASAFRRLSRDGKL